MSDFKWFLLKGVTFAHLCRHSVLHVSLSFY